MNPDNLQQLLRAARPEPPPSLRDRVLTAAAQVEAAPPWWASLRTWGAAAAALLVVNCLVMMDGGTPAPAPAPQPQSPLALAFSPDELAELPPLLVAQLLRPPPPMRSNAPTPLTPIEEILR